MIHLLFSANRWEAAESMNKKLQLGTTLVIDRYSYSGAVYSAAKHNPTLDLEWAWAQEIGLPQPDVVIFLTVSAAVAAERGGFGVEKYETNQMQQNVREMFEQLWCRIPSKNLVTVNADESLGQVEQQVLKNVLSKLNSSDSSSECRALRALNAG